jgi:predicted PurR-regulated permease PerM
MNDQKSDLYDIKIFTGFITSVILVLILKELKNIFIPLFISFLLYFIFNGVVKKLILFKVPRFFVLAFLLVFIFILFYFLGVLIYSSASSFVNKFPIYSEKIIEMIKSLSEKLKIPISEINNYIESIDWKSTIDTSSITKMITRTFGSFATFIGNLILVLIFLMFMLAGRHSLVGRIDKAFDNARASMIKHIVSSIEDQVQHYLVIKTFISLVTALICGIILSIGGIHFVIFSALLVFILNFIPNFGSIIATIFPVLIGFLQFGLSLRLLVVAAALMSTQFIVGNIAEPRITGKSLNLSPIVILISLIFWGYIWGIVGMMLAVPLTSAIKIIFENIPSLKPIAEIISAD